jgi:uncharacterized coiled-coil DUF342 family protein
MASPTLRQAPPKVDAPTQTQLSQAVKPLAEEAQWVVAVGVHDPQVIEAACACPGPVLVVFQDQTGIDRLEERWVDPWPNQLQLTALLLGPEPGERPWFLFNDARLNGPIPLEQLQPSHPNLRLEQVELRLQSTLGQLLERWEPAEDDGGLLLIAGTASDQVATAVPQARRLRSLIWIPPTAPNPLASSPANGAEPPDAAASGLAQLDAQLIDSWLRQCHAAQPEPAWRIWLRDEHLHLRATVIAERDTLAVERDGLVAERNALIGERDGLAVERDGLIGERDGLTQERNALAVERDTLAAQRDALQAERDALASERDGLAVEREGLVGERDGLSKERNDLAVERDTLAAQRDALQAERDALAGERDGLAVERNALIGERDGLTQERNALAAQRDALQAERDGLVAERNALIGERDGLTQERNALAAQRDALQAERDGLAAERDGLIGERDGLSQERNALAAQRDALQAERDDLHANLTARDEQLNRINQELDEILHLIDSAEQAAAAPASTDELSAEPAVATDEERTEPQ